MLFEPSEGLRSSVCVVEESWLCFPFFDPNLRCNETSYVVMSCSFDVVKNEDGVLRWLI